MASKLPPFPSLIKRNKAPKAEYAELLYSIYESEIRPCKLILLGKPVLFCWRDETYGKNDLFWHLITGAFDADVEKLRYDRSERLRYIPYMIEHHETQPQTLHWYYQKRNTKSNIVIITFDSDIRYQCVLQEEKNFVQLKTAYPQNTRTYTKKVEEYRNYWQKRGRP